ncbi:MAG: methyltransferase domain-containing protein [Candidatus Wukongarchaeota archaeon]|nr:methyltransferase domain-containing protein [Candidatus Wukongarchaeota archaeon]
MRLDVGCGANPHGDVNVDAFPLDRTQCAEAWMPKKVRNFVLADAHFLPFREKVFDSVRCDHVLEHLYSPILALKEMRRVCKGNVVLRVPSHFSFDPTKTHIYTWNPLSLKHLTRLVFGKVEVGFTSRMDFLTRGKLGKWIPLLNILLPKIGILRELYAYCSEEN